MLAPKETCQPRLRSIGFCAADAELSGAAADKVRFENTTTRDAYGSRSRAIVVHASETASTFTALTLPVNGSHTSARARGMRKAASTICLTFPVLATK